MTLKDRFEPEKCQQDIELADTTDLASSSQRHGGQDATAARAAMSTKDSRQARRGPKVDNLLGVAEQPVQVGLNDTGVGLERGLRGDGEAPLLTFHAPSASSQARQTTSDASEAPAVSPYPTLPAHPEILQEFYEYMTEEDQNKQERMKTDAKVLREPDERGQSVLSMFNWNKIVIKFDTPETAKRFIAELQRVMEEMQKEEESLQGYRV